MFAADDVTHIYVTINNSKVSRLHVINIAMFLVHITLLQCYINYKEITEALVLVRCPYRLYNSRLCKYHLHCPIE